MGIILSGFVGKKHPSAILDEWWRLGRSYNFFGATNRFSFSDLIDVRGELFRVVTTTAPN